MLSSNRGLDYLSILSEMDRLGYDIQWQNMHTEWYLPQHRQRIYTVGHLRGRGKAEIFPITGTDGENSVRQIASQYCATRKNPQRMRPYEIDGIAPCLNCMEGGNLEPHIAMPYLIGGIGEINFGKQFRQGNRVYSSDATAMCLNSQPVGNTGGNSYLYSIRTKEKIKQGDGIYVEMPGGFLAYCVWYKKYQCYIAIRKLTPKECFRLQGWSDDYFEKAAFVNTDNQLYKQAGNGVTVNVVEAIGKKIKEYENN